MAVLHAWILAVIIGVAILGTADAYAQIDYTHYVESVQVVIDDDAEEVSASVVLESTKIEDIILPGSLETDLRENGRIIAVIFTNTESCILGVGDEACIIINMARVPEETNIILVQDGARALADQFIPRINEAIGIRTQFHSVFVHHNDEQNAALGVPGIVAGYNTVSVVYTMPQRGTQQFLEIMVSSLLSPPIAEGGGFVHAGRELAAQPGSTVTFVAVPGSIDTMMMLKVSRTESGAFEGTTDPLGILGVDTLEPSAYFDDGFYPLNSLVRMAVASQEGLAVSEAEAPIIPMVGDTPEDVTRTGWFFNPPQGTLIRGTYLMGEDGVVRAGETSVTLQKIDDILLPPDDAQDGAAPPDGAAPQNEKPQGVEPQDTSAAISPDGPIIAAIIVAAGAGAAVFYLKGYRRSN